jgi:hypothetical protein
MMKWVGAVREGRSVPGFLPINAPSTMEYAEMPENRIKCIGDRFVVVPRATAVGQVDSPTLWQAVGAVVT